MDEYSAVLLSSIWQKLLVIKVDPLIYLSALTKDTLSRKSQVGVFHPSVNKCLLNTSWVVWLLLFG